VKRRLSNELSEIEEEAAPNENNGLPGVLEFDMIFEESVDNPKKKPLFIIQIASKKTIKGGEKFK
jgi:hypothetical protein